MYSYDYYRQPFGIPGGLFGPGFWQLPGSQFLPGGRPPFGPPLGPPSGPPGGPPSGPPPGAGAASGPPSGPPPSFVPSQAAAQGAGGGPGVFAIDPGAIRPCTFRYVYLWLENGQQFWAWLVFVGPNSVSGWRWTGLNWRFFGTDLRNIRSFICY